MGVTPGLFHGGLAGPLPGVPHAPCRRGRERNGRAASVRARQARGRLGGRARARDRRGSSTRRRSRALVELAHGGDFGRDDVLGVARRAEDVRPRGRAIHFGGRPPRWMPASRARSSSRLATPFASRKVSQASPSGRTDKPAKKPTPALWGAFSLQEKGVPIGRRTARVDGRQKLASLGRE
jgi:hypothetical protein